MLESLPVNASTTGPPTWLHRYEYWQQSPEYRIYQILQLYIPPILIVFGSIGNVLAFVVLTRKHMRHSSICYYMAVFALANTVILYVGCGLDWVSNVTSQPHVANLADWTCKVWTFLFNVIRHSSYWLVVAMTADRVIRTRYPNTATTFCTVFMAKTVTLTIMVGLIVVSVHSMWIFELGARGCGIDPLQRDFETTVWPWILAALSSYLPTLLVMALTVQLVVAVYSHVRHPESEPHQMRYTRVGLCLAVFFLICTLPTLVINCIEYANPPWLATNAGMSRLYLMKMVCTILACLYTSLCFVFYFLLVPAFRAELCLMAGQAFAKYPLVLGEEALAISDLKKPIVCDEFCQCAEGKEGKEGKGKAKIDSKV